MILTGGVPSRLTSRVSVRLVREGRRYEPLQIEAPREVYEFLRDLEDYDREVFYSLHLDNRHRLISCEEVSRGSTNSSIVHPREVYKAALLTSANGIIVAHNHPSGDPSPSRDDLSTTERLYKVGDLVGIQLLDSVIIGKGRYLSMREEGMLGHE